MVRLIRWAMLVVVACAAVQAQGDQKSAEGTCVDPSAIASYEATISNLEQAKTALSAQLDTEGKKWSKEKAELEAKYNKEHENHRSTVVLLRNAKDKSEKTIALLEEKLDAANEGRKEEWNSLHAQVKELETTVKHLKGKLTVEQETVSQRDGEIKDVRAKLAKFTDQVKSLEKDVQNSRKKNEDLRQQLENQSGEVSLSALLSSYYDEGVVLAENAVVFLREQANQSSGSLNKIVEVWDTSKQTVVDTADKIYADNLASTLDPIIADIRVATDPHVKKYGPILQEEAAKLQKNAVTLSQEGLRRAKAARVEAIALLEQNEHVAGHAQKIIDGVLILVAVPLALIQIRILFRIIWWIISTSFCVLTCGICCGTKKRTKTKRKPASKKQSLPPPPTATSAATSGAKSSGSTTTSSSNSKRSKKKN